MTPKVPVSFQEAGSCNDMQSQPTTAEEPYRPDPRRMRPMSGVRVPAGKSARQGYLPQFLLPDGLSCSMQLAWLGPARMRCSLHGGPVPHRNILERLFLPPLAYTHGADVRPCSWSLAVVRCWLCYVWRSCSVEPSLQRYQGFMLVASI